MPDAYRDCTPTPTRSGYIFLGWTSAIHYGTRVTKDTMMGSANVTIYAEWEKEPPTVLSVEHKSTNFNTNPNGAANSCYVSYRIRCTDFGQVTVNYTLTTNDFSYASDPTMNPLQESETKSVGRNSDGTYTIESSVKVYCVLWGGVTNGTTPTTLKIEAGGKSTSVFLPYRAGGFTPGGKYWS